MEVLIPNENRVRKYATNEINERQKVCVLGCGRKRKVQELIDSRKRDDRESSIKRTRTLIKKDTPCAQIKDFHGRNIVQSHAIVSKNCFSDDLRKERDVNSEIDVVSTREDRNLIKKCRDQRIKYGRSKSSISKKTSLNYENAIGDFDEDYSDEEDDDDFELSPYPSRRYNASKYNRKKDQDPTIRKEKLHYEVKDRVEGKIEVNNEDAFLRSVDELNEIERNGKEPYKCHQCKRTDRQIVVPCTKCKEKLYCTRCIKQW